MNRSHNWIYGTCEKCGDKLLVHRQDKVCIWCRLEMLESECEQYRAGKLKAYNSLAEERKEHF